MSNGTTERRGAEASYKVHKTKSVGCTVIVKNAMDGAIDVFLGTRKIRAVESATGTLKFPNLVDGRDAKGQTLTVTALVTDFNLNSNRVVVDITITGGASPHKETLFKKGVKDGETVPMAVQFSMT